MSSFSFLIPGECENDFEDLISKVRDNEIGYSISIEKQSNEEWLQALSSVLLSSFERIPKIQELTYPLLLANSALVFQEKVKPHPLLENFTHGDFINTATVNESIISLYGQKVLRELYKRSSGVNESTPITSDMFLTVAVSVVLSQCTSFERCPDYIHDVQHFIEWWTRVSGGYCSFARAMYVMKKEFYFNSDGQVLWSNEQNAINVTFLYPSSHIAKLIQDVANTMKSTRLSSQLFDDIMGLCNDLENTGYEDRSEVVLPLTVMNRLKEVNGNITFEPHLVSTFALVLADVGAIQRAVCHNDDFPPSFECE